VRMPKKPPFQNPVRLLREALGKTQPEFAQIAGISSTYLQKIELGKRPIADDLIDFMAAAFGVAPLSMRKRKGKPVHQLANPDHQDLAENIRAWQAATGTIHKFVVQDFRNHLLPKLELLFDAANRQKKGTAFSYPKATAISLRLDRWISGIVEDFDLKRVIDQVLQERKAKGDEVVWDRELVIKFGTGPDVALPGHGKIEFEMVRSSKKRTTKGSKSPAVTRASGLGPTG
jgi:transcriptional regulator with XRE-family HTH domain